MIRPLRLDDIDTAEQLWCDAFARQSGAPRPSEDDRGRTRRRLAHLLSTDPGGVFAAVDDDGALVGFAAALVRGELFVLSMLAVAPEHQNRHVGRELLDAALSYRPGGPGIILSSSDPRAMRRYVAAGFDLHAQVIAKGTVRGALAGATLDVRTGDASDLGRADAIAAEVRGGPVGPDAAFYLSEGATLLIAERGFALVAPTRTVMLQAFDEETARSLLGAGLAAMPGEAEVSWITQQWAIRACVEAGLELHGGGAVMVRGMQLSMPYLPSGPFA